MADNLKIIVNVDLKKAETSLKNFKKKVQGTNVDFSSKPIKSVKTELDKASKSAGIFGESMLHAAKKFSEFYIIGSVIVGIRRTMESMVSTVVELDRSLTLMSFTSEFTNQQFDEMTMLSSSLANSLASTNSQVLEAVQVYTNLNSELEEIINNSEAAVVLSNLGGSAINIEQSAKVIQSLQNQFGKTNEEALELVDTITYISSNLKLPFASGVKEMGSAVALSGSLAHEANIEYELYLAILGKTIEQTQRSGSSISSG